MNACTKGRPLSLSDLIQQAFDDVYQRSCVESVKEKVTPNEEVTAHSLHSCVADNVLDCAIDEILKRNCKRTAVTSEEDKTERDEDNFIHKSPKTSATKRSMKRKKKIEDLFSVKRVHKVRKMQKPRSKRRKTEKPVKTEESRDLNASLDSRVGFFGDMTPLRKVLGTDRQLRAIKQSGSVGAPHHAGGVWAHIV